MFDGAQTEVADMLRILILSGFAVSSALSVFIGAIYFKKLFKQPAEPHRLQPMHVVFLAGRELTLGVAKTLLMVDLWGQPIRPWTLPFAISAILGAAGVFTIAKFVGMQGERVVEVHFDDAVDRLIDRAEEEVPWTGEERRNE